MIIKQKRVNTINHFLNKLPKDIQKIRVSYQLKNKEKELIKIGFNNPIQNDAILPQDIGPVSHFNAYGKKVARKDLPKKNTIVHEKTWHWKQWKGRGRSINREKTVFVSRDCYQKEQIPPPAVEFIYYKNIITSDSYGLEQKENLKHCINLFLEFFGECELINDNFSEILKVKRVNWELLPQGSKPFTRVKEYLGFCKIQNNDSGKPIIERQELILSYDPKDVAIGTAGFKGYLAYIFDNTVILESIKYGNAIYIFDKDWKSFSKMTKNHILSANLHKARIIHADGWKNKLKIHIEKKG